QYSLTSQFFLRLCQPPRSTLFPYTTLFRSLAALRAFPDYADYADWLQERIDYIEAAEQTKSASEVEAPAPTIAPSAGRAPAKSPDRKSTRLNSSHVKISYAVFCLKKKNTSV